MDKLKVAIIGVGGIAGYHYKGYQALGNVEVYALCDINEAQLNKRGHEWGITRLYTDVNEMLRELPEIDAVSVCTWNNAHAACTIAALNAGKHVLCEKPMCMSVEEAIEMKKAQERSGKLLMIGFVRRSGNDCKVLKEFIDNDELGEIYYAKATYLRRNGNPGGWFGDKSRSGGGPLIDLGVHVIDLVRYLMGNPKPVSVYGATFEKLGNRPSIKTGKGYLSVSAGKDDVCDVEDLASALIRFDNGAVIAIEASFSLNIKNDEGKIQLFGTKGGAKIDPEIEFYGENNGYMTNTTLHTSTALDFRGLFEAEIAHYVSCITDGAKCIAPAEDGVEIMKILCAIYESAKTGHEVIID